MGKPDKVKPPIDETQQARSLVVQFWANEMVKGKEIGEPMYFDMRALPRRGDYIIIEETEYYVVKVVWLLSDGTYNAILEGGR